MFENSDAARATRNAYHREWRAKNRDKVKAINARYWEKKAQQAAGAGSDPTPEKLPES